MDSEKVLLAIEEMRKWDQREKELLSKLDEIRREREELRKQFTDVKRQIADLDSSLSAQRKGITFKPAAVQSGTFNR